MVPNKSKRTYVKEVNVETQVFDWGKLWWLSEPRVTAAGKFSAGVVQLEPGKGHTRHNHAGCEEILYVLTGRGRQIVEVDGESREQVIGPGVLVHIPPDCYHSTVNLGAKPMRILAIYAPPGPEAELRQMKGDTVAPRRAVNRRAAAAAPQAPPATGAALRRDARTSGTTSPPATVGGTVDL